MLSKNGNNDYQSLDRGQFKHNAQFRWIFTIPTYITCILMIVAYYNLKRAAIIIEEDVKNTTVHDTVYLPPPKIYTCWSCKKELVGVKKGSVKCCGYEYQITNKELVAKRIEP